MLATDGLCEDGAGAGCGGGGGASTTCRSAIAGPCAAKFPIRCPVLGRKAVRSGQSHYRALIVSICTVRIVAYLSVLTIQKHQRRTSRIHSVDNALDHGSLLERHDDGGPHEAGHTERWAMLRMRVALSCAVRDQKKCRRRDRGEVSVADLVTSSALCMNSGASRIYFLAP